MLPVAIRSVSSQKDSIFSSRKPSVELSSDHIWVMRLRRSLCKSLRMSLCSSFLLSSSFFFPNVSSFFFLPNQLRRLLLHVDMIGPWLNTFDQPALLDPLPRTFTSNNEIHQVFNRHISLIIVPLKKYFISILRHIVDHASLQ